LSTEWITVKEVADTLRVHPTTVREWIRSGRLKAARFGGKDYRIKREDYEKFIQEHYHDNEKK
jgi:excisionase family DNA binding protein